MPSPPRRHKTKPAASYDDLVTALQTLAQRLGTIDQRLTQAETRAADQAAAVRSVVAAPIDAQLVMAAFGALKGQIELLTDLAIGKREQQREAGREAARIVKERKKQAAEAPPPVVPVVVVHPNCEICVAFSEGREPRHTHDLTRHLLERHDSATNGDSAKEQPR